MAGKSKKTKQPSYPPTGWPFAVIGLTILSYVFGYVALNASGDDGTSNSSAGLFIVVGFIFSIITIIIGVRLRRSVRKVAVASIVTGSALLLLPIVGIFSLLGNLSLETSAPWPAIPGTDMSSLTKRAESLNLPKPTSIDTNNSGCVIALGGPDAYCERSISYYYKSGITFWPQLQARLKAQGWRVTTDSSDPASPDYTPDYTSQEITTACIDVSLQASEYEPPYIELYARGSNMCSVQQYQIEQAQAKAEASQ